ncbi:UPF0481 protein [Acorus gramineus]|uniref:UPF0481 protein n=1 Tax=Acorus gramineus TaxID=55184 RepID=A0AAV9AH23_ACOGR|nr:UPF0481 protein [Acorus gramineus]
MHLSVTMDVHESSVIDIKTLEARVHRNDWRKDEAPSIFRVPPNLRCHEDKSYYKGGYEPRFVSIGPYHRGKDHLKLMEEHKWTALHKLLHRKDNVNPSDALNRCTNELKDLEESARRCYSEDIGLDSDKFVDMLLLDGCFIVSILEMGGEDGGGTWIWKEVKKDLLLLENQIPFFVIRKLCELLATSENTHTPPERLALNALSEFALGKMFDPPPATHHLLHLFYSSSFEPDQLPSSADYFNMFKPNKKTAAVPDPPKWIPSATKLAESGVKLKAKTGSRRFSFLDVTFNEEDGALEIPTLALHDSSESILRNLIAYEQCVGPRAHHVADYAFFMDCLVDRREDVAILEEEEIVLNSLSSGDNAAKMFNHLVVEVCSERRNNYLSKLFHDVTKRSNSRKNQWLAKLVRDYFSNPWSFISLVAAVTLLLLTLDQTFFITYSYFHPPS